MEPKHGESLNEEEQLSSFYETRSEASIDQSVLERSEVKQEVDDGWAGLRSQYYTKYLSPVGESRERMNMEKTVVHKRER